LTGDSDVRYLNLSYSTASSSVMRVSAYAIEIPKNISVLNFGYPLRSSEMRVWVTKKSQIQLTTFVPIPEVEFLSTACT